MRWVVGKALEGLGMVVVLAGLGYSVAVGLREEGMKSMSVELWGLAIGGGLFLLGYLVERGERQG